MAQHPDTLDAGHTRRGTSAERMLQGLQNLIHEAEIATSLNEPSHLRQRIELLDGLERYLIEPPPMSVPLGYAEELIYDRAKVVQAQLETANLAVYETIRSDIRRGHGRHDFLEWLPRSAKEVSAARNHEGYDYLDEILSGVLQLEEPGAPRVEPTGEMVFYQPTPARHIFDLVERAGLGEGDVLVDLGSGLGHVPMLTAICTGARSVGVELEPAYVDCARRAAETLNLKRVTFIQEDARAASLDSGTVFYLYTPFTGTMLRTMLDLLSREARRREIRICTLGPCTRTVAAESWLDPVGPSCPDQIAIFRSRIEAPVMKLDASGAR